MPVASTARPGGAGAAFERYAPLLARCRDNLSARVASRPYGETLVDHATGGKMLRPLVALAAAEAAGVPPARAIPGAEAIQLLHAASLVHDDLLDQAAERRGRPAAHVELGWEAAIVAGDALLLAAGDAIAAASDVPSSRVVDALRELNDHAGACCRGQAAELDAPPPPRVSRERYLEIVRDKTARPFVAAVAIGATLAGAGSQEVAALRRFGLGLGIAFQIRDDVLDVVGDSGALGKPVGNGLANGRPLLPRLLGSEGCGEGDHGSGANPPPRAALDESMRIARRHVATAVGALAPLPGAEAVGVLRELAVYAVERDR